MYPLLSFSLPIDLSFFIDSYLSLPVGDGGVAAEGDVAGPARGDSVRVGNLLASGDLVPGVAQPKKIYNEKRGYAYGCRIEIDSETRGANSIIYLFIEIIEIQLKSVLAGDGEALVGSEKLSIVEGNLVRSTDKG